LHRAVRGGAVVTFHRGPNGRALYGGGYATPDLSAECHVIIGGTRCGGGANHAGEHGTAEVWTTTVVTVNTPRGPRYRGVCYIGEGMPRFGPVPRGALVRYATRLYRSAVEAREQARGRTVHHNVFHDGNAGPEVMRHHGRGHCVRVAA
jgi:hypothetical protein